jgi:hypothetical protein
MDAMAYGALEIGRRLSCWPGLRFVTGAAGSGKSTACTALARRHGLPVLDIDERLYGSWHGRFDRRRHPGNHAWSTASDPLAWQLAMTPAAFLDFHDASTLEALDLLAEDLETGEGPAPGALLLVDGGFGSVRSLASVVDPATIACIVPSPDLRATAWTADPDRREFLEIVAGVSGIQDPVGRFLALDAALAGRMEADALAAGVACIDRRAADTIDAVVDRLVVPLGIG